VVMPIIIGGDHGRGNNYNSNIGGLNDVSQLRDIISQAVSAQLQLHNIRKEHDLGLGGEGGPLNETQDSMKDEEAKLRCEQQLLRK